jgi:hypothetical protein
MPEIEESLRNFNQAESSEQIFTQIRKIQNLKKLELLGVKRQNEFNSRMRAISSHRALRKPVIGLPNLIQKSIGNKAVRFMNKSRGFN